MKRKAFEKKIDRLWKIVKKDLDRVSEDTVRAVKKGEVYIKDKSEEGKKMLKVMTLTLQREKLYYELGRIVANTPKRKGAYPKKALSLLNEIKGINLNIKKTKKK